jgi:hypothetical protein
MKVISKEDLCASDPDKQVSKFVAGKLYHAGPCTKGKPICHTYIRLCVQTPSGQGLYMVDLEGKSQNSNLDQNIVGYYELPEDVISVVLNKQVF